MLSQESAELMTNLLCLWISARAYVAVNVAVTPNALYVYLSTCPGVMRGITV